jgi:outer membrane protein assembly factor BamB
MTKSLITATFILTLPLLAHADNWPRWRGPRGDGETSEKALPLKWGPKQNVRWKIPLPEDGNSSPIVWGNRIFLTQQLDKKGHSRALMCFDRADGKLLWKKETPYEGNEPTHNTNPYCSATPVTDGERVIASMGSAGMVCYDFTGKELWRYDLGKLYHIWGNASSPVLYGDLAILWCGPGERQFLLAVDKKTGAKVWEHTEPGGSAGTGKNAGSWVGSWSTPTIARIGAHDELILNVPHKVKGFDPKTGQELWHCDGLGPLVYTTPVVSPDGIVVAMSGFYGPALAVRAGGKGDVTRTHRLWVHTKRNPQRIGSAVIVGKHAYMMSEPGSAHCFEIETGKDLWDSKRLADTTWGSMVLSGDRIYLVTNSGEGFVLKAAPKLEVLERNKLGERVLASVAVSDGELFIRSYRHLWCIAEGK